MSVDDNPDKRGAFLVQSFMTGEQKVLLSFEMSAFDQGVRKQKIRREHPDWSELQVKHEILRQAFFPHQCLNGQKKRCASGKSRSARPGKPSPTGESRDIL